jgi:hypothetical protein
MSRGGDPTGRLRGLVLRHRNHGAGERAVGLSQLIQNSVVNSLLFIVRQNRTNLSFGLS